MSLFEETKKSIDDFKQSGDDRLRTLGERCEDLEEVREDIKTAKAKLKALEEDQFKLENESIPTLLEELNMKSVTLTTGTKVSVEEVYKAHISEDNKADAFAWLRENGFDDIIKNDIVVTFGRGEEDNATDLYKRLRDEGQAPMQKSGVHASTLKAFVKEQIQKGIDLPQDKFGVYVTNKVKIT